MKNEKEWLDEVEASVWLSLPVQTIRDAVYAKRLPALVIGKDIRINRQMLLDLAINQSAIPPKTSPADEGQSRINGIPMLANLTWLEKLEPTESFSHSWPRTGGGKIEERFDPAWEGVISLEGIKIRVKIGEDKRNEHKKLDVFFDHSSMCEFISTTEGEWASLIKPNGKNVLSMAEEPPFLYRGSRIRSYREATGLKGIGIPLGAAVVISKDDLESAVYHGAARWLARKGFPLVPKS